MKIKDLPLSEKPYEKCQKQGAQSLSDAQLLSIILMSGTKEKSALELAYELLNLDISSLKELFLLPIEKLQSIKGVGIKKAIRLKAIAELFKRANTPFNKEEMIIQSPEDVYKYFSREIESKSFETLLIIFLDSKNKVVAKQIIAGDKNSTFTINSTSILKMCIQKKCDRFILMHNHPSGDYTPSPEDIEATYKLQKHAQVFDLKLVDHVVVSTLGFASVFPFIHELEKQLTEEKLNIQDMYIQDMS